MFLGRIVKETLENQGYNVSWETDGSKVFDNLQKQSPDICVLDIMLPNIDGYTLCKQIKGLFPDIPVIFLTAKTETADLVRGFESGGTDYIRKPFSMEELIVRIENQLHLTNSQYQKNVVAREPVMIGTYLLFPWRYELHGPSGVIKLSNRDMQVLTMLLANRNKVTDRKDLLMSVWGDDSFFNSRNLDVYIRKLRDYFREDKSIIIQTLRSKGYLFIVP